MDNKDEYINSLLLSLFLMQGEIDRLNETLDLARKGELVYINNPQIEELKAENERLKLSERDLSRICQGFKKDIETEKSYALKYYKTLQEIKAIAENSCCMTDKDLCRENSCTVCKSISDTDVIIQILQLITKAEINE